MDIKSCYMEKLGNMRKNSVSIYMYGKYILICLCSRRFMSEIKLKKSVSLGACTQCNVSCLFQVLINGIWILVSPPRAVHHYPTREDNHLVCSSHIDASYMIAFGYPILLIIICTIYAVLTRKIPEAFNESKHIGMYCWQCLPWKSV